MTRFRRILVLVALVLALPWAMSVRAEYVQVTSELTIHYETSGHGDIAIMFIPGWTMTTEAFVHQLNHFEGSDRFRAIAYDPRGQGYSSKTVGGHTYPQHGRDLAALLEALELEKVILAGWSYGVTEQLAYLNQFGTDKIVGMIMIDTGPDVAGASYDEWVWYLDDDSNGYSRWFTEGIMEDRQTVITGFAMWMLEDPSPDNVAWVADMSNLTSGTVASVLNATGFYLDYSADLVALEGGMPLLYVVREDWQAPAEAWIKANTPSAQAAYLGKHLMFWERPDEFNEILDTYLAQF